MTDLPPAATTAAADAALRALIDALRYGPGVHLSIQEARTVLEVVLPHLPPPPPDNERYVDPDSAHDPGCRCSPHYSTPPALALSRAITDAYEAGRAAGKREVTGGE